MTRANTQEEKSTNKKSSPSKGTPHGENLEAYKVNELLKEISGLKINDFINASEETLEKTIKNMFSVIKNLETHLKDVMKINTAFKIEGEGTQKELKRVVIENKELKEKINFLEIDIPSIADLEKRLELANDEIRKNDNLYKQEVAKTQKLEKDNLILESLINRTKEERDDAYKEIVILENKYKTKAI